MYKRGASGDAIRPKFSILNPALTQTLPAFQTAAGITDIIAHLYERYLTNTKEVEVTDRMIEALMLTNYNFGKAAEKLYIHKNTLVYRYNRLKELLDIDPLASTFDRCFLEAFYAYLRK